MILPWKQIYAINPIATCDVLCFQAYKYQEEYQLSLEGFHRAQQLDPSWTDPQSHLKELVTLLTTIVDLSKAKVCAAYDLTSFVVNFYLCDSFRTVWNRHEHSTYKAWLFEFECSLNNRSEFNNTECNRHWSRDHHWCKADVGTIGYLHPKMAACKTGSKFLSFNIHE